MRRLAATAERERIGRDLHDLLGHTLSLITLKLELSRKLFDRDLEAARREVAEAENVARHALAEVRSAVTGIRATDLAAELASARLLLESSRRAAGLRAPPADLPEDVERGLALVLREAATNIARHAEARAATIGWRREHASVLHDDQRRRPRRSEPRRQWPERHARAGASAGRHAGYRIATRPGNPTDRQCADTDPSPGGDAARGIGAFR